MVSRADGLMSDSVASVQYLSVMGRRYRMALLVVLIAAASMMGVDSANSETGSSDGRIPIKRSPRVFVNTSIPFSVAPQPVGDTIEVAHAKQQFLKTFQRIHDAVVATDSEHLNFTHLEDDLNNNLDDHDGGGRTSNTHHHHDTAFSNRGPAPIIGDEAPELKFNLFPDPILEPEYFLPSVHVDPILLNQLDPPLPPNPFIQQIRPIIDPRRAGTCYEIIMLEPELDIFHTLNQGNTTLSRGTPSFPTHGSLLDAIAPQTQSGIRSNPQSPSGSQIIPVGTPAFPGAGILNSVPQFRLPQRPFFSVLHGPLGGPLTPDRRFGFQG